MQIDKDQMSIYLGQLLVFIGAIARAFGMFMAPLMSGWFGFNLAFIFGGLMCLFACLVYIIMCGTINPLSEIASKKEEEASQEKSNSMDEHSHNSGS